jgi:hypothetical protein
MIKRYLQFIRESESTEQNSIGEWVESLIDDEYIKNIVTRYTIDVDTDIKLANAINILDENIQQDIKLQIDKYLAKGIEEKEPDLIASTEIEPVSEAVEAMAQEEISMAGKGIFTSFLKALTSLGQKESQPNWERCPDNFLIYYFYPNLSSDLVKQIFSRFKSLSRYLDSIDYQKNELSLYFGVRCDGNFEYGLYYDVPKPIGCFRLSQTAIRWMCQLESKSATSLKKEIVNLSLSDVITLGRIKTDMLSFNPGYHESKDKTRLQDKIISFGYKGLGKWDNGKFDDNELTNVKGAFTKWLSTKKWISKVLISVKPGGYWVYLHIKLK